MGSDDRRPPDGDVLRPQARRPPDGRAALGLDHRLEHRRRARRLRRARFVHGREGRRDVAHPLVRRRRRPRGRSGQRDRAELRLDRAAAGLAGRRAGALDDPEPPHPPSPDAGADCAVRRLPRERRVGCGHRHGLPRRRRLHGLQGAGRRDGDDAGGLLSSRPVAAITLEQVTKEFAGGVLAVDDVNLTIADGEFMVLVGPSGCGKSTLLRMIAGLEEVTDGTISIGDRDITDLAPPDRDIAMVFQNYALYPHMSVRQNLGFGLSVRHTPKSEIARRVGDVAALLGLGDLLDRKPAYLSGGQRQRVAMGRAIIREPVAFLMDEPLSNLDAKLRVGMRASLAQLHARLSVTSIYVTHDQTEAMTLGERVAVMRDC